MHFVHIHALHYVDSFHYQDSILIHKLVTVAVYEYANSTSAHDTVLEHRFSPMHTSLTS